MAEPEQEQLFDPDYIAERVAGLNLSASRAGFPIDSTIEDRISETIENPSPELINQLYPYSSSLFRGLPPQRLEIFVTDLRASVFAETVGGREMIGYLQGRIDEARDLRRVRNRLDAPLADFDRLTQ